MRKHDNQMLLFSASLFAASAPITAFATLCLRPAYTIKDKEDAYM
jgi:hypothetical protein